VKTSNPHLHLIIKRSDQFEHLHKISDAACIIHLTVKFHLVTTIQTVKNMGGMAPSYTALVFLAGDFSFNALE
jgi:hypothetical protein